MTDQTRVAADLDTEIPAEPVGLSVSAMARGLIGSEILRIAAEIRAMRAAGVQLCNLTVGDFDPAEFRIPAFLERRIEEALRRGESNYPPSNGMPQLREAVAAFYDRWLGLRYPVESVLITGGSRPGIYATYRTLVDPGDRVVYAVPSWNNNHYCHLTGAVGVAVPCARGDAFLPTRAGLEDAVRGARLLALNSPVNPTGTAFDAETLAEICDLVIEENRRRAGRERPLYVMYDQVYWMLTFGSTRHVDPVTLRPEMRRYTVYVDGISKAFAATGVRVGWVAGPPEIIAPMSNLVGHVGAWAPRAEQVATAQMLAAHDEVAAYREEIIRGVRARLDALYGGLCALRREGFPVDAIAPMGAIYLSARFAPDGMAVPAARGSDGHPPAATNEAIREFLLREAGLAVVPFQAFGVAEDSGWFRLSVGAVSLGEIERMLPRLREALLKRAPA